MKIILTYKIPSPEFSIIKRAISEMGEVSSFAEWDSKMYSALYDLSVCVGPVLASPPAKKRVLFVLGQTINHIQADWDVVVVTSEKARRVAFRKFGCGCRLVMASPPLIGLSVARKRIVEKKECFLHLSEGGLSLKANTSIQRTWGCLPFHVEGIPKPEEELYSDLEFNSYIKAGAIGFYPDSMEDGFDIQVRRHLALGGQVVCRRDNLVLGDLADLCCDKPQEGGYNKMLPIECAGREDEYTTQVQELLRRI